MNITTAVQVKQAEVTENGVMVKPQILQIYTPKTNFNNKGIKWYEDKLKPNLSK